MIRKKKRKRHVHHTSRFMRERRISMGLSMSELASMFNPPVTTQFVSHVERCVLPVPFARLHDYMNALKIDRTDLENVLAKDFFSELNQAFNTIKPTQQGEAA